MYLYTTAIYINYVHTILILVFNINYVFTCCLVQEYTL